MNQLNIFQQVKSSLVTLREASEWASNYLSRYVSISNISYLIQYGRIKKYDLNGNSLINIDELREYYDTIITNINNNRALNKDLNWGLSFIEYTEAERTKHVHRLHPYKGKFIPQLVEYFIDSHTDEFKKEVYFNKGDLILDPFCGSGTTLVQANELGIHAIGIDISPFNVLISNVKILQHNILLLSDEIKRLTYKLRIFQNNSRNVEFEENLLSLLSDFNAKYFPSPEYKRKVRKGIIDENQYALGKEKEFLEIYYNLVKIYLLKIHQDYNTKFLDKWFLYPVRREIDFLFNEIKKLNNNNIKRVLAIIMSRTMRSCRATTHADLATLKDPVATTYYCKKHGKICKPIFSIMSWWLRYTEDTLNRLAEFDRLRTNTFQICITGDSRNIDLIDKLNTKNQILAEMLINQKASGIFSSPPYVGLIDYHDQHAYSYDIFGFERNDHLEIGPLSKGQGKDAREAYIKDIAIVLVNCKKYLKHDYNVLLVANDKFDIYPQIANLADMKIVNLFKRPVLNRVEKDRSAYSETIFNLKEK